MTQAIDDLANTRVDYTAGHLDGVAADPLTQFTTWYEEAQGRVHEPNAMVVSTVDEAGPDARIVLLKTVHPTGFVFFTNYESRKGQQLAAHPHIALTFPWHEMQRQVRLRGVVEKIPAAESDAYFASRPRGSQLGSAASHQSAPVASREALDAAYAAAEDAAGDGPITRPDFWGGYLVKPWSLEFWQGRTSRLHDRFQYTVIGSAVNQPALLNNSAVWQAQRLYP